MPCLLLVTKDLLCDAKKLNVSLAAGKRPAVPLAADGAERRKAV
jgi:hypothetical protein